MIIRNVFQRIIPNQSVTIECVEVCYNISVDMNDDFSKILILGCSVHDECRVTDPMKPFCRNGMCMRGLLSVTYLFGN